MVKKDTYLENDGYGTCQPTVQQQQLIPERFTLVKLEGYCPVYGPHTIIASPGVPARL